MAGQADLDMLLAVIEKLDRPDRRIDSLLDVLLADPRTGRPAPSYTGSVDAAVELVKHVLPGWLWRVMSCSVSDDAWVTSDFNDPVHGARLKGEWPPECHSDPLGYLGTDLDRRPSGQPAIALVQSLLVAKQAIGTERMRRAGGSREHLAPRLA